MGKTVNKGYHSCIVCSYSSDSGYVGLLRHAHKHKAEACELKGIDQAEHVGHHFIAEDAGGLTWTDKGWDHADVGVDSKAFEARMWAIVRGG